MMLRKHRKIKGLTLILMMTVIPLIFTALPTNFGKIEQKAHNESQFDSISNPQLSLPASNYEWWNKSWSFRIPIGITAVGSQQNAPIELLVNFTKYFNDINVQNPLLNTSSIRVIEYISISNYYEVDCQFDPYKRSYNNQSNAIGDMIWILNGSTSHGQTRDFYIYFNNGSSSEIPEPNYDKIRLWHEGFEEYQTGDIFAPTDGQDRHPSSWHVSNTTSARGDSSLRIWGNCWKESDITAEVAALIDSSTIVTVKMRFDDPDINREISGIGFTIEHTRIPLSGDSYNIRGNQAWGSAGTPQYQYRNVHYADNTFFWYTLDDLPSTFRYIFYEADDDDYDDLNLYWDDISIWDKTVQTTPNNSLQTEIGNMQAISFSLKITCKDEQGNRIQNAQIFITNSTNPSLNQGNFSDSNGEWIFTNLVKDGLYNITINYTQNGLSAPITETVYYYDNYQITNLNNYLNAYINITTINFGVLDKDDDPIQYGYVLLKEGGTTNVGKGILSDTGNCTIRWVNNTNYAFEVYFDYSILPDLSTYRYDILEIDSGSVNIGTHNIYSFTELSKVNLNVTQFSDGSPFTGAKLRFYNKTDYPNENEIIANITVGMDGIIRFISFSNETTGDWGNYTLDVFFADSDEWPFYANGVPMVDHNYTFSMNLESNISIEIDLNREEYYSTISFISITSDIFWRDSVSFEFNFTKRDPTTPNATLVTPSELYMQILDEEQMPFSDKVDILSFEVSTGVFNYIFNTTQLSLTGGNGYWIEITGNYKSYVSPDELQESFEVQALPTNLTIYDYSLIELENKEISEYYNELVNITVKYYNINTGTLLEGATLSYSWDYGSGAINPDPLHSGYYYFEIDTSDSPNIGKYRIELTAKLENYSTFEELMDINILRRPTSINGTTILLQSSPEIYILSAHNYSFVYRDILSDVLIGDLDVASYNWYKLDEEGNPLSGPGNEGTGILTEGSSNIYILDFNTELKELGEYTIFITLQKNNYEVRNAFISLSIKNRPIDVSLDATGLSQNGKRIDVIQGTNIDFQVTLTDPSNADQLLTGATVILRIGHNNYTMNETSNGVYEYRYSTANIDAFMFPQTLDETYITIEKENYEDQTVEITIVVGMTEIFSGFPMFYFLLLVIGIVAVVGSLVAYRQIQRARIPTFVKKTKAIKSTIKSRKSISESLLYPSKESYIVKQLGDKWETLGLSLEDILGIEPKKGKKSLEKSKNEGGVM